MPAAAAPAPVATPFPLPDDEQARLDAVRRSGLRGAAPEAVLDGLVKLAARICRTASAEINLVDASELQFVAAQGLGTPGQLVPRELTFCTWTILDPDRPTVTDDPAADPRFAENPFVSDGTIGSYAGFPLLSDGQPIGTMCVHDPAPLVLDAHQLEALKVLAAAAQAHVQLRREVEDLEQLARTDALTGAANRRAIDDALVRELARVTRSAAPLAFLLLDLDHFKAFNDAHGHQAGDLMLQRSAAAWREQLRASDLLGRWGGEEFCVILPDCAADQAEGVADRLRRAVPEGATCSIGVASWEPGEAADALVARADAALYAAKRSGRDRVGVGRCEGRG